jgi:hypothetical protein
LLGLLRGAILIAGAALLPSVFLHQPSSLSSSQEEQIVFPEPALFRILGSATLPAVTDFLLLRFLVDDKSHWVNSGSASHASYAHLITELDPFFLEAYVECARFLAVIRNDGLSAARLVEKGLRVQAEKVPSMRTPGNRWFWPSDYALPFTAGYVYLFELADFERAAGAFAVAGQSGEAPPYVASLASRLSDRKARFDVGLRVLAAMKSWMRNEEEQNRLERRIRNLYLIQYLDALRAEFEAFLQSQSDYRKEVHLPKERMQSLFERFMKGARLEPKDPYGGRVFIDDSGQVTTSTPYESEMGLR